MSFRVRIYDTKYNQIYKLGKLLGKGGFGRCHEIKNKNDEKFAIKMFGKDNYFVRRRIKREIDIHLSLTHENIVKMHHYFEDEKNFYIVLELCEQKTLWDLVNNRGILTEVETRFFSQQIAKACEYFHNMKIVHRDLKLENIFLDSNLNIKIGDFGLAVNVDLVDMRKSFWGTRCYTAPEVIKRQKFHCGVDIWALGCIIYILLSGTQPFEGRSDTETNLNILKLNYTFPFDFSESTIEIINALLHVDPDKRPSMSKLLRMMFFRSFIPKSLPLSAWETEPDFDYVFKRRNRRIITLCN